MKERLHSAYPPQKWPKRGPGTTALNFFWLQHQRIIILMNIYLYIFLDLLCAEGSCLSWLAYDWTIWFFPRSVPEEPDRVQRPGVLEKQDYFLWSVIHSAPAELADARQGNELQSGAGFSYTAGGGRWRNAASVLFLETFPWTAKWWCFHLYSIVLVTDNQWWLIRCQISREDYFLKLSLGDPWVLWVYSL